MKRRYLFSACCLISLFSVLTAQAQVTYLERSWDSAGKQVKTETKTRNDCREFTGDRHRDNETLKSGWYVVKGEAKRDVITFEGEVHLILSDGCVLKACLLRINASDNAKLYVYSQSDGDKQGKITVFNDAHDQSAAIGSSNGKNMGSLYIHGGDISTLHARYRFGGAGIGGGYKGQIDPNSELVIYGGKVTASPGTSSGAGIGGGDNGHQGGPIIIYGGVIDAKGDCWSAGIGGGYLGDGGKVTIYGGKVTARGGIMVDGKSEGAGIGGGRSGKGGDVHIHGGEVYAYGGYGSAGIGGSYQSDGGSLEVTGGHVYASGYEKGDYAAPGIGGGDCGNGGKVTITGGIVEAVTKHSNKYSAAPIGSITAEGGHLIYDDGEIALGEQMKVMWSNHNGAITDAQYRQGDYLHYAFADKRVESCMNHSNTYVIISPCTHAEFTYGKKDDTKHWHMCKHCNYKVEEAHTYKGGVCVCGQREAVSDWWTMTIQKTTDGKTYTADEYLVIKGMETTLPAPPAVDGLVFMGYLPGTKAPDGIEMKDSEQEKGLLLPAGLSFKPSMDCTYYARYRFNYKEDWQWSDDFSEAKVTLTHPLVSEPVTVKGTATEDLRGRVEPTEDSLGEAFYMATAAYNKAPGITYRFENWQRVTLYQPRIIILDALDTDEENTKTLDKYYGFRAEVTINNLTIMKDGRLHPICLPFNATLSSSPLEGATLYQANRSELNGQSLKVEFQHASSIEAGVPYYYCFYDKGTDVQHPTFNNVIIDDVQGAVTFDDNYNLIGTYEPLAVEREEGIEPVMFDGNEFVSTDNAVTGFSNFLYVHTKIQPDGSQAVRTLSLVFESNASGTFDKKLPYYWEGAGTEASPYMIKNARQLKEMTETFNNDAASVQGKYFRQGANIAFDKTVENNFTPVKTFNGHYDGAGFVISGVNIGLSAPKEASLFGSLEGNATIKNVVVKNSAFKGNGAAVVAAAVFGNAGIENCHVLKDVTVESDTNAGGVVGVVNGNGARVTGCTSQATVKGFSGVGGIAGLLTTGYVGNSIALGNSITGSANVNAVVGYRRNGTVENCYFTAPTLSDPRAKLMPDIAEDNTNFLNQLNARDRFLLEGNGGLKEENICYDLRLNGREYKATQQADGTWKSKAFAISLPFDMAIPEEQLENIKVYQLHWIDTEKKTFIFTNDFPILKAGEPYLLVISKGSLTFNGKNVLVKEVPMEPQIIKNAGGSKELGYWCSNFRRLENEELVEEKAYIMQHNGTFRHIDKVYASKPYVARFVAYFSAIEPIGTTFKMRYIQTENGVETGEETDFPADEFYSDSDIDEATGIAVMEDEFATPHSAQQRRGKTEDVWYDLQGRKLSGKPTAKGLYIMNGKKMIFK